MAFRFRIAYVKHPDKSLEKIIFVVPVRMQQSFQPFKLGNGNIIVQISQKDRLDDWLDA